MNCPNCGREYNPGDEVCPDCGLVFPFTTDVLAAGTILQGRYEIQELTHTGGMGYIYLAKDRKLYDRLCIVKQVKEPVKSDSDLKKLEEEARRMAKLSHPNVAMILDHFVEGDYYFLVVERISGKTLSEVFEECHGQLTEDEVVNWAIAMCDVISYIHSEEIIHRDISSDNVMLTKEGAIKFVDFGTLRELRYITTKGTAGMGKYGYTPPEQWQGKPTPQSDIFALGATVYYLLTGSLPLSKEYLSGQGPQRQDFSPMFPPIRQKNPDISPELEAVLQRALQLDANSRYSLAAEMGQALRRLGMAEVPGGPPVEAAKPVLSVDCERLDFAEITPGARPSKSFTLKNVGTGRLTGKITTTQPWLEVVQSTIDLKEGQNEVHVTVDTWGLGPGFNGVGDINIATNGGKANVGVNLSTVAAKPSPIPVPTEATRKKKAIFMGIAVIGLALLVLLVITIVTNTATPGRIIFRSDRSGDWENYIMNADGGNQVVLSDDANYGYNNMNWAFSPDRQKWVYRDDANCVSIRSSGGSEFRLSCFHGVTRDFAWSAQGTRIAFVHDDIKSPYHNIYVINADGSNLRKLTTDTPGYYWDPSWSPDGTEIAFICDPDGNLEDRNLEIYVMDADGSNQRNLTKNSAWDSLPDWSPDGNKIAFVSDRDGNAEIYIIYVDGSGLLTLTKNPATDSHPDWSPDGTKIAFSSDRDGNREIYIMNSDGSSQTRLTNNTVDDDYPVWSPKRTR